MMIFFKDHELLLYCQIQMRLTCFLIFKAQISLKIWRKLSFRSTIYQLLMIKGQLLLEFFNWQAAFFLFSNKQMA